MKPSPVPNPVVSGSPSIPAAAAAAVPKSSDATRKSDSVPPKGTAQAALQAQIQQQLQQQLQAAAAKGQQADISPEQIQRQAQAMVQAAAQAQAVVAAAKSRGDGLVRRSL